MTDISRMRHRITFQSFNGAKDSHGDLRDDLDSNWTAFTTVWASIDPIAGREFYEANQSQSEVTHNIRCRAFAGCSTAMRIKYGSRIFKIVSVIDFQELHEFFLIKCTEVL